MGPSLFVTECLSFFHGPERVVVQPPPDPVTDVRYRLFFGDMNAFGGRDIFTMFSKNMYHFYEMTGETPDVFAAAADSSG